MSDVRLLKMIITSHSAHACDGTPLRLHCPRHSTISIQSAFYGSGEVRLCTEDPTSGPRNHRCSALTALQKILSECQNLRDCQLPVSHLLFGKDPCPGKNKYLHVNYKCKPTEHKTQVVCEGETIILHCKTPNVLIIYAAVYGRGLGQTDTCPSLSARPPPFECLNYDAVQVVSKSCYSKQKCTIAVGNQTFRDPCFPGTRKYLSVLYSCVPKSLLKEADPNILSSTSLPTTEKDCVLNLLLFIFSHIDHPEMAALLFTSSVCVGLLFTLLALSVQVTCRRRRLRDHTLGAKSNGLTPNCSKQDDEEDEAEDDEDDKEETESSLLSTAERKGIKGWEEVTYVSEEAELAERIERRDMIIQEIWMNSYLNGSSC
uniref:SUEL-type lectin domain-containing protein n=1 Tax=Xiphophorus couchianus TaxID=32473 RepID=A0A3B5LUU4_9TELE